MIHKLKKHERKQFEKMLLNYYKEHSKKYSVNALPEKQVKSEAKAVEQNKLTAYVYEQDGKLTAFVTGRVMKAEAYAQKKDIAYIISLYVKPKYRGKGIVTKLIQKITKEFLKQVDEIRIDVFTSNAPAKKLYEKQGFKTIKQTMQLKKE